MPSIFHVFFFVRRQHFLAKVRLGVYSKAKKRLTFDQLLADL